MLEKEQQSSSSQEQGTSAYDEDRKALLVLAFMPKPEIQAFLADQGFVPPTFDKDDPHFIGKPNLEIPGDEQYIFENGHATEDDIRASGQQLGGAAQILHESWPKSMPHREQQVWTIYSVVTAAQCATSEHSFKYRGFRLGLSRTIEKETQTSRKVPV
ncbi:MAG: hypothetical protein EZS28_018846 [Streblomastix strix]|uniref:Uncharacterized protein n=1 Tax=Streblomastix strix TaxID=222440 RepID=A0A5J4VT73_9EUKA|nr:MAG: hypothetical protein EZS28_018846 [Streblomastix strix]